jgi:hypothetical protein
LIRFASPARVRPGASSTNRPSPVPISFTIVSSHSTGETICSTSRSLMESTSRCAAAVTFE